MQLKYLKTTLFLTLILIMASCSDNSDEPKGSTESNNIEYYVKYELSTTSRYIYSTVTATITTEKGTVSMDIPRNWDGTFGPFNKPQEVVFLIKCDPEYIYNTSTYNGRISICRGNQPYILKADKTISNAPLEMSYVIILDDLK